MMFSPLMWHCWSLLRLGPPQDNAAMTDSRRPHGDREVAARRHARKAILNRTLTDERCDSETQEYSLNALH